MSIPHVARSRVLATALFAAIFAGPPLNVGGLPLPMGVRTAAAQRPCGPPTAVLLKRLGEVVDGYPMGDTLWVVISCETPHRVRGLFANVQEAERAAAIAGPLYANYGPYLAPRDPFAPHVMFGCKHTGLSMYDQMCPDPVFRRADVESVTVTVRLKSGQTQRFPLTAETDAIFLTLSAFDKFAVPYYTRILGVDATAAMRQDIVRKLPSR